MKNLKALIMAFLLLSANPGYTKSQTVEPPQKLVMIAEKLAFKDFPKAVDILAIMRVESRYIETARNGISIGVMQVNHGPKDLYSNIKVGTQMLRDLYEKLGSINAAVMAYNLGLGGYKSGRRNFSYLSKYKGARNEISNLRLDYGHPSLSGNLFSIPSNNWIPGSSRSILFYPDGQPNDDTLQQWGSQESKLREGTPREVLPDLGEIIETIKRRGSWDSYSGSSLDP